ncbi:MAG: iron-containing alcohol dehydrogenase [Deltaproteobacteria bacterium]|nr:iron-containing alcohol dehydrogenase [Deltaproteobacteria bacterium]
MSDLKGRARELLRRFKGDQYAFGEGVLPEVGPMTAQVGRRALLVGRIRSEWFRPHLDVVRRSLWDAGVEIVREVEGAKPNAPREDVYRLEGHILHTRAEVVVSVESGSGIDACKAASVLATFGDLDAEIDSYFGVGQVTRMCEQTGRTVLPVVAVMTAASSAAHLTKYSNVTDPVSGQKKLIVDDAIVPPRAVFDYALTHTQPISLTLDGGLDGVSHCLEVYLGAKGEAAATVEPIALTGIELILQGLPRLAKELSDKEGRELVALGTDLGGYAIMVGGTSGAHLNSFSFVKYLSHGRACALMNPYYTVFFSPAVEDRVRKVGEVYQRLGYGRADLGSLSGKDLGIAVAEAMIEFNRRIGFPTSLKEVDGLDREALEAALRAAKDPQLESKLQNMPVPLTTEDVDRYMGAVLEAAWEGDLRRIVLREG